MRYVGGKSKLAKGISEAILDDTRRRISYVEPFLGGASVASLMVPHFVNSDLSDAQPDIALMWEEAANQGWIPPEKVTEAEYSELKDAEPSALRGFVGFGGSFGGKWFGGYARGGFDSSGKPRNHQGESARAVNRIAPNLHGAQIRCLDYRDIHVASFEVVYCDPPYASTQGYSTGSFDSEEFWRTAEQWTEDGAHVYVSEYEAPEGWEVIWEKSHRQSLTKPEQGREIRTERLFTRRQNG